jgi:energy-converting hydrogenase A subunit O
MRMFEMAPLIGLRSRGPGTLTTEAASRAHAVGPRATASGITEGRRLNHLACIKPGFLPVPRNEGDDYAQVMVRFQEVMQSIDIKPQCLSWLPSGKCEGGHVFRRHGQVLR